MLPKLDIPIYETILPVSQQKIEYRPMLVKEEKIVLLATESKDDKTIQKAVEQVLTNCIVNKVNPNDLPLADVEYLLIQIRDKSLGGIQESEYICNENGCDARFKLTYNFTEMKIDRSDNEKPNKIQLSKTVGIKLKPPSYGVLKDILSPEPYDYKVLADVVEVVYDDKQVYKLTESSAEEIEAFFDSFPKKKIEELYAYIDSMPKYTIKKEHVCKKCGHKHEIVIQDLANLFT